jgi:membrane dipeptidase
MHSRILLIVAALILTVACAPADDSTPIAVEPQDMKALARGIHERVLTIDTHDDIPFEFATADVDPGVRGDRQVDLPKMREGGLDVGFFVVYVGQDKRTPENDARAYEMAISKFDAIHRMTDEMYPDQIELAHTADDVERIWRQGKLVASIGIENGWPVGNDLANLATFHELGARYITLAHGGHNQISDSSTPRANLGDAEEEHGGISEFGAEVIAEMNRLGIMVDVSHISKNAMLQAAALSQAPVIASHSGVTALADVARNMDDEQLLALKANGGVVQLVALGAFVKQTPERDAAMTAVLQEMGIASMQEMYMAMASAQGDELAEMEQTWTAFQQRVAEQVDPVHPAPGVADFVDHIDHAVALIGIDHVGISSDFDGGGGVVGWNDASETFNVTLELVERGYSEEEIAKIWGGNLLRVWRENEAVAARLQAGN